MSIASEIERLQTSKADLKNAIMAKGVEIADTDTIDTYASKVDEIQSGGGDSWYDTFWDNCQDYGTRTNYDHCFSGQIWNDNNFSPKYDIKPEKSVMYMFAYTNITDLQGILERNGVTLDISKVTDARMMFYNSPITRLGVIDCSKCSGMGFAQIIYGMPKLQSVEKLILPTAHHYSMQYTFQSCPLLTDISFEGNIYLTTNLKDLPLNAKSAISAISCLINFADTDKEFTYTITFSETTWNYLNAEGNASPNGNSWREYINDLGWNAS